MTGLALRRHHHLRIRTRRARLFRALYHHDLIAACWDKDFRDSLK